MKSIKAIILIAWAFFVASFLSACTFTRSADGSVSGSVDAVSAAAIATKIIAEK